MKNKIKKLTLLMSVLVAPLNTNAHGGKDDLNKEEDCDSIVDQIIVDQMKEIVKEVKEEEFNKIAGVIFALNDINSKGEQKKKYSRLAIQKKKYSRLAIKSILEAKFEIILSDIQYNVNLHKNAVNNLLNNVISTLSVKRLLSCYIGKISENIKSIKEPLENYKKLNDVICSFEEKIEVGSVDIKSLFKSAFGELDNCDTILKGLQIKAKASMKELSGNNTHKRVSKNRAEERKKSEQLIIEYAEKIAKKTSKSIEASKSIKQRKDFEDKLKKIRCVAEGKTIKCFLRAKKIADNLAELGPKHNDLNNELKSLITGFEIQIKDLESKNNLCKETEESCTYFDQAMDLGDFFDF